MSGKSGTFYLGACVADVFRETMTGNNCSDGARVDVDGPTADLTVSDFSVSDANPDPGTTIQVPATVLNQGDVSASATTLRYYRSNDATINSSDRQLLGLSLAALDPAETVTKTYWYGVPSTPGTFYLGACVDSVPEESDTDNNCSTGAQVVVE